MHLLSPWVTWLRRVLRAMGSALDPGEDDAPPTGSAPEPVARVVLTHDDLLWFKTSQDAEGRITLGLRLSRAEAQDLHRSLVTWLAGTARTVTS